MSVKKVGIVDAPSRFDEEDSLGTDYYAYALVDFITQSDTPITIGVQGEWGSGKTSLLNTIYGELEKQGTFRQIWVNSWEHSIMATPEQSLISITNEIINEILGADIPAEKGQKVKKLAKNIFTGAAKISSSVILGNKASDVVGELLDTDEEGSVKALRQELENISQQIRGSNKNQYQKIVVYVDDLDRIEPKNAVALLELLKNIFNVSGCIFVLAIDYQVVVKGLEHKFGARTDANEWEFRAFFDKIIQLPFMMPMGQYDIGKYVLSLLDQIDYSKAVFFDGYAIQEIVERTTGGNPRALKRLINSLSLIELFSRRKIDKESQPSIFSNNEDGQQKRKLLLFAIVCIQIAYPEIYELLLSRPNFKDWNEQWIYGKTQGKEEALGDFSKQFEAAMSTEDFDEDWEKALYRICFLKPRYRSRVSEISQLLTFLADEVLKGVDDKGAAIAEILSQTAVTSVTTTDEQQKTPKKSVRDTTKYFFDGKKFGKGKLALSVVKKYVSENPEISFSDLLEVFPPEIQGRGVFVKLEEAREIFQNTGYKRHYIDDGDVITLSNEQIAISSQWGKDNVEPFIEVARKLGFKIT